jgi:hypothetical protein
MGPPIKTRGGTQLGESSCVLLARQTLQSEPASLILSQEARRTGGQEDRRTGGQEDRRTGGQEDRRTGGQEDRRTGGQEDRRIGTRMTGSRGTLPGALCEKTRLSSNNPFPLDALSEGPTDSCKSGAVLHSTRPAFAATTALKCCCPTTLGRYARGGKKGELSQRVL